MHYHAYLSWAYDFRAFHTILVTWFLVVFGNEVTKILQISVFTFFTEQGKTGKNRIHGNENFATYFWYFGIFDKKKLQKYVMGWPIR